MITTRFHLIYYYCVATLINHFVCRTFDLYFGVDLIPAFDCYTPHLSLNIIQQKRLISVQIQSTLIINNIRIIIDQIQQVFYFNHHLFTLFFFTFIYQSDYTKSNIVQMNKDAQMHRNKCQGCFKAIGRFILDCYCILCEVCFSVKTKNTTQCQYCWKPTKGNFIDVKNQNSVNKMSYLFGNIETSMMRCLEIYKFQVNIDLRYCKFLENQIDRYKQAIRELVEANPALAGYFDAKLGNKTKNQYKSVSERIQNPPSQMHMQNQNRYQGHNNSSLPPNTPRSLSSSNIQMHHEQLVDPHRVNVLGGDRNYSGKMVNYKVPNINYNTAMRSSKRPPNKNEDDGYYRERR